jgi:hypothetical protein
MSGITACTRARELAVADLAALRPEHEAGLADAVRREVVVQHEGLAELARERVDDLRVAARAQRGDDQRLGLAPGEQRRAVRARQHTGADRIGRTVRVSRPSMRGSPRAPGHARSALERAEGVLHLSSASARRLGAGQLLQQRS